MICISETCNCAAFAERYLLRRVGDNVAEELQSSSFTDSTAMSARTYPDFEARKPCQLDRASFASKINPID